MKRDSGGFEKKRFKKTLNQFRKFQMLNGFVVLLLGPSSAFLLLRRPYLYSFWLPNYPKRHLSRLRQDCSVVASIFCMGLESKSHYCVLVDDRGRD